MNGSYLGPKFENNMIEDKLKNLKAIYKKHNSSEIISFTAKELSKEKTVGWFQGRMEFGPRALGGRSILADPRSEKMQKELNLKIKFRESFRPFAPSILREDVKDWFELDNDSPYMLLVADIKKEKQIKMTKNDESLFGIEKLNVKRSSIPAITTSVPSLIKSTSISMALVRYSSTNRGPELNGFPSSSLFESTSK